MKPISRHRLRPRSAAIGAGHNGFELKKQTIVCVPIDRVTSPRRRLKKADPKLAALEEANLRETGLVPPILVDASFALIDGEEVLEAARALGVAEIPVLVIDELSETQIRRYRIWLRKRHELSAWDVSALKLEFDDILLSGEDLDLSLSGFSLAEIDGLVFQPTNDAADDDMVPAVDPAGVVTRRGDLWQLGPHRILCADALDDNSYTLLLDGERAALGITDSPYCVPIKGHVSTKKNAREFLQGAAEMNRVEFEGFLGCVMTLMKLHSEPGSIHAFWMDWRGLAQLLPAAAKVYHQTLNLCVWDKQRPGLGSLYRSQHELCIFFKTTDDPHRNNVALGVNGRTRSNVWSFPGMSQFGPGRQEALNDHPTIKPTALISEILLDVSKRNDVVLDPFLGSGTTIIAAHRTGRRGYGIEIDPIYVDVAIRRIEERTGLTATLAETGESFTEVKAHRATETADTSDKRHG